jgi:hypothetical protein
LRFLKLGLDLKVPRICGRLMEGLDLASPHFAVIKGGPDESDPYQKSMIRAVGV